MSADRETVLRNLGEIREGIGEAARASGRAAGEVRLVAIGKTMPAEVVSWVIEAGVGDVGENYVKELAEKREQLGGATWHYVGSLQSHTAHLVAEDLGLFVQDVDFRPQRGQFQLLRPLTGRRGSDERPLIRQPSGATSFSIRPSA